MENDFEKAVKDGVEQAMRECELTIGMTLKEAVEKQIAKKPIGTHTDFKCPVCNRRVRSGKGSSSRRRDNFCQRCGQKLNWEET